MFNLKVTFVPASAGHFLGSPGEARWAIVPARYTKTGPIVYRDWPTRTPTLGIIKAPSAGKRETAGV